MANVLKEGMFFKNRKNACSKPRYVGRGVPGKKRFGQVCGEIIEKYREVENVEIIYQKNKGLNATNNVALKRARGKYIMRLDANDYLELSAVAIMAAMLEIDPELGLVFPDYYYVDADGNITGQERRRHFDDEVSLYDVPTPIN